MKFYSFFVLCLRGSLKRNYVNKHMLLGTLEVYWILKIILIPIKEETMNHPITHSCSRTWSFTVRQFALKETQTLHYNVSLNEFCEHPSAHTKNGDGSSFSLLIAYCVLREKRSGCGNEQSTTWVSCTGRMSRDITIVKTAEHRLYCCLEPNDHYSKKQKVMRPTTYFIQYPKRPTGHFVVLEIN